MCGSYNYVESVDGPKTQQNIVIHLLKQQSRSALGLAFGIEDLTNTYPVQPSTVRRVIRDLRAKGHRINNKNGQYQLA